MSNVITANGQSKSGKPRPDIDDQGNSTIKHFGNEQSAVGNSSHTTLPRPFQIILETERGIEKGRTSSSSIQAPTQPSPEMLSSTWSTEDSTLVKTLQDSGLGWDSIATQPPRRSADGCCDHYDFFYKQTLAGSPETVIDRRLEGDVGETADPPRQLSPAIPKSHWSREDDSRLAELTREGWCWEDIAKDFPGRSVGVVGIAMKGD
jgi:hypothetical protein